MNAAHLSAEAGLNRSYLFCGMVGMARRAVPAREVAGGTNVRATLACERVAPLHAARTSQRDVPTRLYAYTRFAQLPSPFSLTPCFSWGLRDVLARQPFQRLSADGKPLKAVARIRPPSPNQPNVWKRNEEIARCPTLRDEFPPLPARSSRGEGEDEASPAPRGFVAYPAD